MEPNTCEIFLRLKLPITLVADIDREATRHGVAIDELLGTMLIQAMEERQAMANGLIGSEEVPAHLPDSFRPEL